MYYYSELSRNLPKTPPSLTPPHSPGPSSPSPRHHHQYHHRHHYHHHQTMGMAHDKNRKSSNKDGAASSASRRHCGSSSGGDRRNSTGMQSCRCHPNKDWPDRHDASPNRRHHRSGKTRWHRKSSTSSSGSVSSGGDRRSHRASSSDPWSLAAGWSSRSATVEEPRSAKAGSLEGPDDRTTVTCGDRPWRRTWGTLTGWGHSRDGGGAAGRCGTKFSAEATGDAPAPSQSDGAKLTVIDKDDYTVQDMEESPLESGDDGTREPESELRSRMDAGEKCSAESGRLHIGGVVATDLERLPDIWHCQVVLDDYLVNDGMTSANDDAKRRNAAAGSTSTEPTGSGPGEPAASPGAKDEEKLPEDGGRDQPEVSVGASGTSDRSPTETPGGTMPTKKDEEKDNARVPLVTKFQWIGNWYTATRKETPGVQPEESPNDGSGHQVAGGNNEMPPIQQSGATETEAPLDGSGFNDDDDEEEGEIRDGDHRTPPTDESGPQKRILQNSFPELFRLMSQDKAAPPQQCATPDDFMTGTCRREVDGDIDENTLEEGEIRDEDSDSEAVPPPQVGVMTLPMVDNEEASSALCQLTKAAVTDHPERPPLAELAKPYDKVPELDQDVDDEEVIPREKMDESVGSVVMDDGGTGADVPNVSDEPLGPPEQKPESVDSVSEPRLPDGPVALAVEPSTGKPTELGDVDEIHDDDQLLEPSNLCPEPPSPMAGEICAAVEGDSVVEYGTPCSARATEAQSLDVKRVGDETEGVGDLPMSKNTDGAATCGEMPPEPSDQAVAALDLEPSEVEFTGPTSANEQSRSRIADPRVIQDVPAVDVVKPTDSTAEKSKRAANSPGDQEPEVACAKRKCISARTKNNWKKHVICRINRQRCEAEEEMSRHQCSTGGGEGREDTQYQTRSKTVNSAASVTARPAPNTDRDEDGSSTSNSGRNTPQAATLRNSTRSAQRRGESSLIEVEFDNPVPIEYKKRSKAWRRKHEEEQLQKKLRAEGTKPDSDGDVEAPAVAVSSQAATTTNADLEAATLAAVATTSTLTATRGLEFTGLTVSTVTSGLESTTFTTVTTVSSLEPTPLAASSGKGVRGPPTTLDEGNSATPNVTISQDSSNPVTNSVISEAVALNSNPPAPTAATEETTSKTINHCCTANSEVSVSRPTKEPGPLPVPLEQQLSHTVAGRRRRRSTSEEDDICIVKICQSKKPVQAPNRRADLGQVDVPNRLAQELTTTSTASVSSVPGFKFVPGGTTKVTWAGPPGRPNPVTSAYPQNYMISNLNVGVTMASSSEPGKIIPVLLRLQPQAVSSSTTPLPPAQLVQAAGSLPVHNSQSTKSTTTFSTVLAVPGVLKLSTERSVGATESAVGIPPKLRPLCPRATPALQSPSPGKMPLPPGWAPTGMATSRSVTLDWCKEIYPKLSATNPVQPQHLLPAAQQQTSQAHPKTVPERPIPLPNPYRNPLLDSTDRAPPFVGQASRPPLESGVTKRRSAFEPVIADKPRPPEATATAVPAEGSNPNPSAAHIPLDLTLDLFKKEKESRDARILRHLLKKNTLTMEQQQPQQSGERQLCSSQPGKVKQCLHPLPIRVLATKPVVSGSNQLHKSSLEQRHVLHCAPTSATKDGAVVRWKTASEYDKYFDFQQMSLASTQPAHQAADQFPMPGCHSSSEAHKRLVDDQAGIPARQTTFPTTSERPTAELAHNSACLKQKQPSNIRDPSGARMPDAFQKGTGQPSFASRNQTANRHLYPETSTRNTMARNQEVTASSSGVWFNAPIHDRLTNLQHQIHLWRQRKLLEAQQQKAWSGQCPNDTRTSTDPAVSTNSIVQAHQQRPINNVTQTTEMHPKAEHINAEVSFATTTTTAKLGVPNGAQVSNERSLPTQTTEEARTKQRYHQLYLQHQAALQQRQKEGDSFSTKSNPLLRRMYESTPEWAQPYGCATVPHTHPQVSSFPWQTPQLHLVSQLYERSIPNILPGCSAKDEFQQISAPTGTRHHNTMPMHFARPGPYLLLPPHPLPQPEPNGGYNTLHSSQGIVGQQPAGTAPSQHNPVPVLQPYVEAHSLPSTTNLLRDYFQMPTAAKDILTTHGKLNVGTHPDKDSPSMPSTTRAGLPEQSQATDARVLLWNPFHSTL